MPFGWRYVRNKRSGTTAIVHPSEWEILADNISHISVGGFAGGPIGWRYSRKFQSSRTSFVRMDTVGVAISSENLSQYELTSIFLHLPIHRKIADSGFLNRSRFKTGSGQRVFIALEFQVVLAINASQYEIVAGIQADNIARYEALGGVQTDNVTRYEALGGVQTENIARYESLQGVEQINDRARYEAVGYIESNNQSNYEATGFNSVTADNVFQYESLAAVFSTSSSSFEALQGLARDNLAQFESLAEARSATESFFSISQPILSDNRSQYESILGADIVQSQNISQYESLAVIYSDTRSVFASILGQGVVLTTKTISIDLELSISLRNDLALSVEETLDLTI